MRVQTRWFYLRFVEGFIAILPIVATIYVIYAVGVTLESALGGLIRWLLVTLAGPAAERFYVPGLGLFVGAAIVLLFGVLLRWVFVQAAFSLVEVIFDRIPLVKSLYGSVKDLLVFFAGDKQQLSQVVMVRLPFCDVPVEMLGLVTRETFDDLPAGIGGEGMIAVYIPQSYQIAGYTIIVPRTAVRPVDMTMEAALRFAITAGMKTTAKPADPPASVATKTI